MLSHQVRLLFVIALLSTPTLSLQGSELHDAARKGDVRQLNKGLNEGCGINDRDEKGMTALHIASLNGKLDCVEALLNEKANHSARLSSDVMPIHLAAFGGHEDVIETLLVAGSPAAPREANGATPLHYAAIGNHYLAVESLLKSKTTVDPEDARSYTPLHNAIRKGHANVVLLLCQYGAKPLVDPKKLEQMLRHAIKNAPDLVEYIVSVLMYTAGDSLEGNLIKTLYLSAAMGGNQSVFASIQINRAQMKTKPIKRLRFLHEHDKETRMTSCLRLTY